MTPAPQISIIIPAYNCARFLPQTLDSIVAQSASDWECLVVDDGSTDDTAAIVQSYAERDTRFRLIRQANRGPSAARNHGFRASSPTAQYFTFMDSDDIWLPDALATLRNELERYPERVGAHGLADFIDADGKPLAPGQHADFGRQRFGYNGKRYVWWGLEKPTCFAVLSQGNVCFPPGVVLARRTAYEKAGLFDEHLRLAEDWDMLIRLSRFGDFHFVNRVVLLYKRHDSNFGASTDIPQAAWRVRCKAFFSPENTPEQQRLARNGWRAYQIYMMRQRLKEAKRYLNKRQYKQMAGALALVPVHYYRYVQGHPTLPTR